ncbi:MAG TPA: amino acid adenylation domain-containing protein [Polyangiaceae bacterium]|nr:amino acid adenylation domain-containing protein [Polyangiaceae bacterium]
MDKQGATSSTNVFPLSYAQERLWFLEQMAPGNPYYNLQLEIPLPFAVDESIWARVLGELLRRHETLRTTFTSVEGRPLQVVAREAEPSFRVVDLTRHPPEEQPSLVEAIALEDGRHPFDLAHGPLLRGSLIRVTPDASLYLVTMHHIVTDGWSMDLLVFELSTLYEAFAAERPSPLPPLRIQYADFAVWQRDWLASSELERQLSYWKKQLENLSQLELPEDLPRPPIPTFRGSFQAAQLPRPLVDQLRQLGQTEGATLFMTLLAAFKVLMFRYSGQTDIAVGSPIANRSHPDVEQLIGFFVNTLVMRTSLAGRPTFRELLARVRETTLSAYGHQDLPFEKLVEELRPERDPSRNPLFQVMFVLQTGTARSPAASGSMSPSTEPELDDSVTHGSSKFDLTLYATEAADGLGLVFEYSSDLFTDTTISRMLSHWQTLLQSIVTEPDQPISRLSLLTPNERYDLLVNFNSTHSAYPQDRSIAELFEERVRAAPDATALASETESVSYAELDRRGNQLARLLRARGVGADSLVGVSLPRSCELVIAVLAIVKAGGAYVPFDSEYPTACLQTLARSVDVKIIIGNAETTAAGWHTPEQHVIVLDELLETQDDSNLEPLASPTSLAYVPFTSGSTGIPKAVAVTHRNVVRLVRDTNYVSITERDSLLLLAPLQFDASTFEIWGALLNGARLHIFPPRVPAIEELATFIERNRITILWLTAALFHRVVEAHLPQLWGVSQLLAGGDVLSPSHCQRLLDALPNCTLINGYGPTETATFASFHRMNHGDRLLMRVPIGVPLANGEIYVLDSEGQLAPIGVPGELVVGGAGVSAGYLNDPQLTAERFIAHPFAPASAAARVYRTGDRVRFNHDGVLEFLGRSDQQVKIRGFRVELGEVEAALRGHPSIRDACVVVQQDAAEKRLVGYVVPTQPGVLGTEVRRFVQQLLPDYSTPAAVVVIDALPMTTNGKVDRAQLQRAKPANHDRSSSLAAPVGELEQLLAAVWTDVLDVESVGRNDNFFDLGGHSLLVARVYTRLRESLGYPIAMVDLFRFPTIQALAAHIASTTSDAPNANPELGKEAAARAELRRRAQERRSQARRQQP